MEAQTTNRLFVTINEAARLTGLSRGYIRQGCRDGLFPAIRVGESNRNAKYLLNFPQTLQILESMTGGGNE